MIQYMVTEKERHRESVVVRVARCLNNASTENFDKMKLYILLEEQVPQV